MPQYGATDSLSGLGHGPHQGKICFRQETVRRLPLAQPLPAGDYYVMISRSNNRPNCEVYPWTVRQAMPAIPIPLRNPDPDVQIDLGQVFDAAYARGRYAPSLPYHKPPRARLKKEDKQWAGERAAKIAKA